MPLDQGPYTISAEGKGGPRSQTRCRAASAMCLADEWGESGCWNVVVIDGRGIARDRHQFRATLPLVRLINDRLRKV